jgi:hypothetical protein
MATYSIMHLPADWVFRASPNSIFHNIAQYSKPIPEAESIAVNPEFRDDNSIDPPRLQKFGNKTEAVCFDSKYFDGCRLSKTISLRDRFLPLLSLKSWQLRKRFFVFKVLLFSTLPPEISCFGPNPSQKQNCLSVLNLLILVPHFRITVCARETPMSSTRQRSAPPMRFRRRRIFSLS